MKTPPEKFKGESYRRGYQEGFTAGLRRAVKLKPKRTEDLPNAGYTAVEGAMYAFNKGYNSALSSFEFAIISEIGKTK